LFGRKSGESVKVKVKKIGAAGYGEVGIRASGYVANFILTENTRRMTPHLLKSVVQFKSNFKNKIFFFTNLKSYSP